jgi:hypothetical protein
VEITREPPAEDDVDNVVALIVGSLDYSIELRDLREQGGVVFCEVATNLSQNLYCLDSLAVRNEPSVNSLLANWQFYSMFGGCAVDTYLGDSGRSGMVTSTIKSGMIIKPKGNLQRNSSPIFLIPKLIQ